MPTLRLKEHDSYCLSPMQSNHQAQRLSRPQHRGKTCSHCISCTLCICSSQHLIVLLFHRFPAAYYSHKQWELHSRNDCKPAAHSGAKKPPRKRCAAPTCKEVLRLTNAHVCTRCHARVCLAHRYPDAHSCQRGGSWGNSSSAAAGVSSTSNSSKKSPSSASAPARKQPTAAAAQRTAAAAANSVMATAARRRQGSSSNNSSGTGREVCPQCSAAFSDVTALIAHVDSAHSSSSSNTNATATTAATASGGEGACPFCSLVFVEATELVAHVEFEHPNGGTVGTEHARASKCAVA
jgi:uncharacterized C2H2 Zn-finger protein